MFKMTNKAAAVALVLGAWAAQAAASDLITLSSSGASTTVGGIATAHVQLTVNEPFTLMSLDGLLGYGIADLSFQTNAPVYNGFSAAQIAAIAPPGWDFNFADPLGASVSVISALGTPVAAGADALTLSFKGLSAGSHLVMLELRVLDEVAFSTTFVPAIYSTEFTITVNAVPEPATYALMLGGLVVVGALARRRTRPV
jgi:hypothetical protein